ncbi:MAG: rRNA maturation RNase YbeY [Taibaiella sp.]|nr:rRNA maturation RNase YbeY [Taibaiella sp.]
MPARFYEQEVKAGLKYRRKLSAFLDALVHNVADGVDRATLTYIFCNDAYLLQMNQQYLDHDTFTDIITFDMSDAKNVLTGEIYISTDRVADNAVKYSTTYEAELHRVIFHGALHLCGYKDKKESDKKEMRRMEDECLQMYFKD